MLESTLTTDLHSPVYIYLFLENTINVFMIKFGKGWQNPPLTSFADKCDFPLPLAPRGLLQQVELKMDLRELPFLLFYFVLTEF